MTTKKTPSEASFQTAQQVVRDWYTRNDQVLPTEDIRALTLDIALALDAKEVSNATN